MVRASDGMMDKGRGVAVVERDIVLKVILQKAKQILLLTQEIKTIRILIDLEISEKHDKGEYVGVQSDSDIEENESSDINGNSLRLQPWWTSPLSPIASLPEPHVQRVPLEDLAAEFKLRTQVLLDDIYSFLVVLSCLSKSIFEYKIQVIDNGKLIRRFE
ncbi:hypothetical protein Tco_0979051 [Tanacetum coccineum]|uniref:Uncharacterized protein n=1 Tax=Tanacetum coccineum TaxID=301880 RepID=A0ABQ5EPL2_9ASTR